MSTAEILAELPKLSSEDRDRVHCLLLELEESDSAVDAGPSETEMRLLDESAAEYDRGGVSGRPWREVIESIRATGAH